MVIDPRDTTAQRDQAQAQLGLAIAQLHQARAQLALSKVQYPAQRDEAKAQVLKAQADLANAQAEYRRQRGVDPRATTQQSIDSANAQLRSAQAGLASAQAQLEVAEQVQLQIRQQETNVEARERQVDQAKAQLETANLNLSYTEVRAPFDGVVTKRNVQPGTLVQAGTALFSLVSPNVWVVANFKESQLERMKPGDKVTVSVDAWPDMELEGHVDSIQQGSGSRFSAFPAENATGNFVKIVQRVPVKIVIDKGWIKQTAAAGAVGCTEGDGGMTDHSHDSWKPASNPWAVAIVVTGGIHGNSGHHHRKRGAPHVAGSLSSSYDESTRC